MPRRGESCTACHHRFEPGESLRVYLYETAEGYQRRDYCMSCAPSDGQAPMAVWTTRRPEATRKTRTLDWNVAFRLFEQLADAASDRQTQLRFLLALLLWRKRVLRLVGTTPGDDREIWLFTESRSGTQYRVLRPELDEGRLETLSQQLEQVLSGAAESDELLDVSLPVESDDA